MNQMTEKFHPKKAFVLYQDFFPALKKLSVANRGHLITAIFEYHGTGKVSFPMKGSLGLAFETVRATLDRDAERYEQQCVRNRKNAMSGRERKQNAKPNEAKTAIGTDIDIDIDIDKNIDMDIDIEKERGRGREPQGGEPSPKEAPQAAPPTVSDPKIQEELYRLGIPLAYARERFERAEAYAKERTMKTVDVLFFWWKKDRGTTQSSPSAKRGIFPEHKSYDIDEFAADAVARSWAEILGEQEE